MEYLKIIAFLKKNKHLINYSKMETDLGIYPGKISKALNEDGRKLTDKEVESIRGYLEKTLEKIMVDLNKTV